MTETTVENEVHRLRVRIIGLTTRQLDELVEPVVSPETQAEAARTNSEPRPRRAVIVDSLAEFSTIGSEGRAVPVLGDQSLADQIVVLLEHGLRSSTELPEAQRDMMLNRLLDAAIRLRRSLA